MTFDNAHLFPMTAQANEEGHLILGGCNTLDLAIEFGTPLYVYDDATLRAMCREFVSEFAGRYPGSNVVYASKAFINPAIATLVRDEGLGLDVVSGGELAVALAVQFPPEKIYFHGNNKTPDELQYALQSKVGRIVVDGFHELSLLNDIAGSMNIRPEVMLRLSPGVDPHTHEHTTTGVTDSKFGFSIQTGEAERAIRQSLVALNLDLVGIHFHLGSPIFELEPYTIAIDTVLTFLAQFQADGLHLREFSPGGGFAASYVSEQTAPSVAQYAEVIASATRQRCADLGWGEPRLTVEPGRSIVSRAGVALYTVGSIKDIPSVRKYVALDGGMGDNIRPALYDAKYEAAVANKMSESAAEKVTLVGKFCESGDYLIRDIDLPPLEAGDLVAVAASGAYAPAMASNYNSIPRPAIVLVKDGEPRLIRRRETYDDLMRCDIFWAPE